MKPIFVPNPLANTLVERFIFIAVIAIILVALGHFCRPQVNLIELWPVNALLASLVIRFLPVLSVAGWLVLSAAVVFGSFLGTGSVLAALSYSAVTLSGVFVAWFILARVRPAATLRRPKVVVSILLTGLLASLVHSLVYGLFYFAGYGPTGIKLFSWAFGEWLGYSILMPVVLFLPNIVNDRRFNLKMLLRTSFNYKGILSVSYLVASLLVCHFLGGPGALLFPLVALIYCAYSYSTHTTAWLVLFSAIAIALSANDGWSLSASYYYISSPLSWLVSSQLGMQLLIVTPLLVASTLAARKDQILALNYALDYDSLTGALSRQAFARDTAELLSADVAVPLGSSVMMLDIDHFKNLNDNHGHAAGDNVLHEFARTIRNGLRPTDLFGRLGGEEFSIMLPNTSIGDSIEIAERLRQSVEGIRLYYDSDEPLRTTVSIGIVHTSQYPDASNAELFAIADSLMYKAKNGGRNRVVSQL